MIKMTIIKKGQFGYTLDLSQKVNEKWTIKCEVFQLTKAKRQNVAANEQVSSFLVAKILHS